MENLPRASPMTGPLPDEAAVTAVAEEGVVFAPERSASGIWSIEGERLVSVEDFVEGPAVVLVRSEHVLVLAVELPPMASMARRRAALPFAIEDQVADPLEEVHVALGAELSANLWLVGVVRHDLMRQWIGRLADAGLERASLVPDAMALPVPGAATWSVDLAAGRAMVRAPDGTGFALPQALFGAAWKAAGEPECVAYGEPLPLDTHGAQTALEALPLANRLLVPALDLRQGQYAPPRRRADPLWKRIAIIAALGALAHGAIATADTIALQRIADTRNAEVRALAGSVQPSLVIGPDLATTLSDMTPDSAANRPSPFLSLLSATGAALTGVQPAVLWRSVAFDRAAGTLTLEVEGADIASLQVVAPALTKAGLSVQAGAASTDQGRAVGTYMVHAS